MTNIDFWKQLENGYLNIITSTARRIATSEIGTSEFNSELELLTQTLRKTEEIRDQITSDNNQIRQHQNIWSY